MKIQEFRIGNYVLKDLDEIIITGLKDHRVWNDYHVVLCEINGIEIIKGIPLTEDWLLKFGFEKIKDENSYCDDGEFTIISKHFTVFKKGLITHNSIHGWYLDRKQFELNIKYVHQLQNLYFALTGEELTINNQL